MPKTKKLPFPEEKELRGKVTFFRLPYLAAAKFSATTSQFTTFQKAEM